MITQEDIDALHHDNDFESVRRDVENAYKGVCQALHYLGETGDYESNNLDYSYEMLDLVKQQLERMLRKEVV